MSTLTSAKAWLHQRPLVADALLAVALLPPCFAVPRDLAATQPTGLAAVLTLLACAALVLRRRWPVAVWALTLLLAIAVTAMLDGMTGVILPCLVALYTVSARTTPVRAALYASVTAIAVLLVQVMVGATGWGNSVTWAPVSWCGLSAVAGIAVRNQRRIVADAHERARVAEESREEEAQRRVTEERLRIARELHDVVAHHIAVIQVQSGVAEHLLDTSPETARASIAEVRTASREVLDEMTTLLGLLRSGDESATREPARGLEQLDDLVASVRRTGLHVSVRQDGSLPALSPLADVTAYRVIEEALTNAHRYGTGHAELSLAPRPNGLRIEVASPMGVAPAEPAPRSLREGLGLAGMRERVEAVGGTLAVGPDGHRRFVVHVELPTPPAAPATRHLLESHA